MTQINRLKDAEVSNGNIIDADDLDAEFDQLVNESNSQDTRLTTIESEATTYGGVKTYSDGISLDTITEKTSTNGVSIDGVVCKDSMIKPSSASPTLTEGFIAYDSDTNTYIGHNGSSSVTFSTSGGAYPSGYMLDGKHLLYNSTSQVIIPSGFKCRDDSDAVNINFTSNTTVDITTATGAAAVNCLMNGLTEGNSTWYYVWAISKDGGADPKGLLTTSPTTIATMPTDYTKKKLIGAVRNDSSGNFIPFVCHGPTKLPLVQYKVLQAGGAQTPGPTIVVDGGTATSYTNVDLSAFVPSLCTLVALRVQKAQAANPQNTYVREDGAVSDEWHYYTDASRYIGEHFIWKCSSSQIVEYKTDGTVDISVWGFILPL